MATVRKVGANPPKRAVETDSQPKASPSAGVQAHIVLSPELKRAVDAVRARISTQWHKASMSETLRYIIGQGIKAVEQAAATTNK